MASSEHDNNFNVNPNYIGDSTDNNDGKRRGQRMQEDPRNKKEQH